MESRSKTTNAHAHLNFTGDFDWRQCLWFWCHTNAADKLARTEKGPRESPPVHWAVSDLFVHSIPFCFSEDKPGWPQKTKRRWADSTNSSHRKQPKSNAHFTLKVVQQHRKATGLIKFKYRTGHARCRQAPLMKRKALGKRGERTVPRSVTAATTHTYTHTWIFISTWPCDTDLAPSL